MVTRSFQYSNLKETNKTTRTHHPPPSGPHTRSRRGNGFDLSRPTSMSKGLRMAKAAMSTSLFQGFSLPRHVDRGTPCSETEVSTVLIQSRFLEWIRVESENRRHQKRVRSCKTFKVFTILHPSTIGQYSNQTQRCDSSR